MKKGYTLIEILVVITIIGLLFSFGFAGFREFSRRQELISAVSQITADLRMIQSRALAGDKNGTCVLETLVGWEFLLEAEGYSLNLICRLRDDVPVTRTEVKSREIKGITLSATDNSLIFKVLGQGLVNDKDVVLTLLQNSTGKTAVITITRSGEIK